MAMFFSEAERDEAGASTNFLKNSRRVFLQDTIVSLRDQLYVPRESSCPIPLTHINVTRHVRDEYVDVLDMSTSAEQTPRSKHTMKATRGQVRLASSALCTLGFMLQMASGMRALGLTTSFALTLPRHRGTTMCAFVSSLRGRGPWCGGGCSSLARCALAVFHRTRSSCSA